MKNLIKGVSLVLIISVLLIICFSNPPNVSSIERCFESNYNDIQIVVKFMENSNYASISIKENDGTMRADLTTVTIEDKGVRDAVERLLGPYGDYHNIYKYRNTITISQWKGLTDIGCGIAYSINETDTPYVEFATVLKPLNRAGWYYYVDDYNAWRTGKRP